jgi:hypothetical protein
LQERKAEWAKEAQHKREAQASADIPEGRQLNMWYSPIDQHTHTQGFNGYLRLAEEK